MTPFGKQDFITDLQATDKRVLMVGDGLNDAGALRTAHVGMAVSEQDSNFSPACDGILAAAQIDRLPAVLSASRHLRWVLGICYGFAFLYNVIGLSYAVTGTLSPVVAAILMPLSSVTVVVLASVGSWLLYRHEINHNRQ
jgi:Cu+-exporting ATPase